MEKKAKITWFGGRQFVGTDSSKHSVVMSSQDDANGTGMSPLELMLVALGGCTAMGVVDILLRKRQDLRGFEINISGDQREEFPRSYQSVNVQYIVTGRNIDKKTVADAIKLSLEKYCSVSGTIKSGADIIPSFKIVDV
ncbi:MAG: OsmC family protein [Candidatus Promineifilaceae bacterium]|nr:OsmC family protein [Candidatus Promineifilaceae bacterium]